MTIQKIRRSDNRTSELQQLEANQHKASGKNKLSNAVPSVTPNMYQTDTYSHISIPPEMWQPERLSDLINNAQKQTGYTSEDLALNCIRFSANAQNLYTQQLNTEEEF